MATLRFAFLAGTCALLLAASVSSSPLPSVQRDEAEWTTTAPPAGNGTEETLTQWADRQRFHVGDILDFENWNGTVLLLARRGDYDLCGGSTTASPPWPFVESSGGGGATKYELDRPGTFYFVSGVPGRCEAGQKMAVRVGEAPFFTSDDDTTAPPPPPPAPTTVVFKVTTSVWLWVATVGIFVAVLLFVIFYCMYRHGKLAYHFLDALAAARNKALSSEPVPTV